MIGKLYLQPYKHPCAWHTCWVFAKSNIMNGIHRLNEPETKLITVPSPHGFSKTVYSDVFDRFPNYWAFPCWSRVRRIEPRKFLSGCDAALTFRSVADRFLAERWFHTYGLYHVITKKVQKPPRPPYSFPRLFKHLRFIQCQRAVKTGQSRANENKLKASFVSWLMKVLVLLLMDALSAHAQLDVTVFPPKINGQKSLVL